MPRGVYIEIRHQGGCPASGRDARNCRCAPTARARVVGLWVLTQRLGRDWRRSDLDDLELSALKAKQDHDSGRKVIVAQKTPRLADWGDDWISGIAGLVAAGSYSPMTLRTYRSNWTRHLRPAVGDLLLTQVTTARVNTLRAALSETLAPATVQQVIGLLAAMLADAIPRYIDTNAAVVPRRRRHAVAAPSAKPVKVMEVEFARNLLAVTTGQLHDMILHGLMTGCRQREIMGVKRTALDLARGRELVDNQVVEGSDRAPKMGRTRTTILPPSLVARLQLRLEHRVDYVYLDESVGRFNGLPYREWRHTKLLNDAWEALGERPKGYSWHVLRHTFASVLDAAGIRGVVIDALMGHENPGVAARYRHAFDEEVERALEVVEAAFGYPAIGVAGQQAERAWS